MGSNSLMDIELFQSLPGSTVVNLWERCRRINLETNEMLFKEGDLGNSIFVILSGRLGVYKDDQELSVLWQGQFFGEMAVIDEKPRSATIIANSPSTLLEIDRESFFQLLSSCYPFLVTVLKTMSLRSRGNIEDLALGYRKIQAQERFSSQLHQILDRTPNAIVIFDYPSGQVVRSNTKALQDLGYLPKDIHKLTVFDLIEPASRNPLSDQLMPFHLGNGSRMTFPTQALHKNGTLIPANLQIQPMGKDSSSLYIAIFEDLAENNPTAVISENQSNYDSLTGLPNRILAHDRIKMYQAQAERQGGLFALLVLDIDNFKTLNEGLGHQAGDQLLRIIANRLVKGLRKEDTVARLGNDEFLLLTSIREDQDATRLSRKIMDLFEKPFLLAGEQVRVSASLGVSLFPHDGQDPATLLMGADAALYRAKEVGKNTFQFYNVSLITKAAHQLKMENALYQALDREEFVLYYQPKVDTQDRHIVGVEALLRWNHPEQGLVPPGEFISIAESSRLILPLGEWILNTACRTVQSWVALGFPDFSVAVNISGFQFNHGNLVDSVKTVMNKTQVIPKNLELELTETILLDDSKNSMQRIQQLKNLGIQLTLDDFGTGYSSLTYLRDLPVDHLKIDRSFISQIHDRKNHAIIQAIISLSKTMGLVTIAEGVEQELECSMLSRLKCDQIQGFLFSKPVTENEISTMLQHPAHPGIPERGRK